VPLTDLHSDCDTPREGRPSVNSTTFSRHRPIAGVSADNRVDSNWPSQSSQYATKQDIGSESRFVPTPRAFDAPVRVVYVKILL